MILKKITLLCFLFVFFPFGIHAGEKPVLRVLNWASDNIDIDSSMDPKQPITERSPSLKQFMADFNCDIEYSEYGDVEDLYKKMQNLPGYYDVLISSSDLIKRFLDAGKLARLELEMIPNAANIYDDYRYTVQDPEGVYFIPYMIGTTGLVYRKDIVGHDVTSWKDYFEPAPQLRGKLATIDTQYMICFAMKYLNIDIKTKDDEDIKRASRFFYRIRKEGFLSEITSDPKIVREKMLKGDLAMSIAYSYEALRMVENDKNGNIKYVIPREGSEIYIDGMLIFNDAPNKKLANRFINFMSHPEVNARIAVSLKSATPNRASVEIIKTRYPKFLNNPFVNIPDKMIKRLEIFYDIPFKQLYRYWERVKKTPVDNKP